MDANQEAKLELEEDLKGLPEFKGRYPTSVAKTRAQLREEKRKRNLIVRQTPKGLSIKGKNKMDEFVKAFLKHDGNATQAAMEVFNCKNRATASAMGHTYKKRFKLLGNLYLEKKGYTYGKLMDVALRKMEDSKVPDWWDRVMGIAGHETGMEKKSADVNVNIFQAEKDILSKYANGDPEEVIDLSVDVEETEKEEIE